MATPTAEPKKYGVTAPLATELPTESQLKMNESLLAELQAQNNFASTEDTEQRQKVLHHFEKVAQELIKHVGKIKKLSQSVIDQAGCKVFTFGSYRLGVYGPGEFSHSRTDSHCTNRLPQDPILILSLLVQNMSLVRTSSSISLPSSRRCLPPAQSKRLPPWQMPTYPSSSSSSPASVSI